MFWPILAILSRIYALFGVPFKGLNSAVAYHNWQISGVVEFITKTSVNGIFNGTLSGGLWSWLVSPQLFDQIVLLMFKHLFLQYFVVWSVFCWYFLDSLILEKFSSISIWTEVANT